MPAPPHRIHWRSRQPVAIRRVLVERALPPVVKTRQIAVGATARSERGAALTMATPTQASHNVLWVDVLGVRRASAAGVAAYGVIHCVVRLGLIAGVGNRGKADMLCGGSRRRQRGWGVVGDESGAVLVFTVVIMAVLLMFAALAIDLPMQMNERRTAQNATDHAALSASWATCTGGDPVAAAVASLQENGYATSDMTLTHLGGTTFEARVDTASQAIFSRVMGFEVFAVSTQAIAECVTSAAGGSAVFASGDTCSSFGQDQIDISGSTQFVYGGIHSNDNIDVSGSVNDFGPGNPPETDSMTYLTTFTEG